MSTPEKIRMPTRELIAHAIMTVEQYLKMPDRMSWVERHALEVCHQNLMQAVWWLQAAEGASNRIIQP